MGTLSRLYRHSLSLLTDLYELTMAYGYWKLGMADRESVFSLSFRENPFHSGFAVACGLHDVIDYLQNLRFDADDCEYLGSIPGNDGKPLFDPAFLDYLRKLEFSCDVDAIPEGTVVFATEPLVRVSGPLLAAQIIETALLTLVNFQTLVATKAARICWAAKGDPVLEFGLRRAQGVDGGVTAARAAVVGGCVATSNLLAAKLFGIPVRGTHAHSWVMSFDSELEAFDAYARVMPNNCVFLVDTYNTLEGVRHAVEIGRKLREMGHELIGIRLDSGDLAYLSIEARKILDAGGFPKASILASNDLDETIIASLKEQQGAKITVWGVGTKLATAYDQPALGGVYKLAALRDPGGTWQYKVKLSEQAAKITTPGILQVRRYRRRGLFVADAIYDQIGGIGEACTIIDPFDPTRRKTIEPGTPHEDLLLPIFRKGKVVYDEPDLMSVQRRTKQQIDSLHAGTKRFINPHLYPVGLEERLYDLRMDLILKARATANR
jgi:nicotinate phosphoribosyltransferase